MGSLHGRVIGDIQLDDMNGQLFAVRQCAQFCCRRGIPSAHCPHAGKHDVSLACQGFNSQTTKATVTARHQNGFCAIVLSPFFSLCTERIGASQDNQTSEPPPPRLSACKHARLSARVVPAPFPEVELGGETIPVQGGRHPLWFTVKSRGPQNMYHAAASKKPEIIKKCGEPGWYRLVWTGMGGIVDETSSVSRSTTLSRSLTRTLA